MTTTNNGTKDAADTNVVSWVVEGVRYDVDLDDIDGVEWRDISRVTGLTQAGAVHQALISKEFAAIGAFLWIVRRRSESDLTYEGVLRTLKYRTFTTREDEPTNPPG